MGKVLAVVRPASSTVNAVSWHSSLALVPGLQARSPVCWVGHRKGLRPNPGGGGQSVDLGGQGPAGELRSCAGRSQSKQKRRISRRGGSGSWIKFRLRCLQASPGMGPPRYCLYSLQCFRAFPLKDRQKYLHQEELALKSSSGSDRRLPLPVSLSCPASSSTPLHLWLSYLCSEGLTFSAFLLG